MHPFRVWMLPLLNMKTQLTENTNMVVMRTAVRRNMALVLMVLTGQMGTQEVEHQQVVSLYQALLLVYQAFQEFLPHHVHVLQHLAHLSFPVLRFLLQELLL